MSLSNSKILLVMGTVITVFMSINLVKAISENRKVQDRINKLQSDLTALDDQNRSLSDTFEFVQTDLFIEQECRDKLNCKKPGETVVSLPPEKVAVNDQLLSEQEALIKRQQQSNISKWWDYFFAPSSAAESTL
ncbi:hypothetical protein AUK40_01235 [Candidatus Wirthbacteria bacterium CG2_30_54_11]|uniref:Septum formation initiator n=1 Tax=Candidatus Wirthbacteria bacterium CG2_30_54_11 TaxID=1817892 RepID=A0A1J5INT5_9BACT|nr:MAG: hypothetical protein AUK40_01235 [Candidatus Wirthbacteria bacterium CG2_30_54_11]